MKYLIVGRQGCGLSEVVQEAEALGLSVGHVFRNIRNLQPQSYTISKIIYELPDIEKIEESGSYIFMQESFQKEKFLEGLSFYEYDNHDIIYMGVEHMSRIPQKMWDKMDVTLIWLDGTSEFRMTNIKESGLNHNFKLQEDNETFNIPGFIERVYDKPHIYFLNEDPKRVATILYSLVKYPDLLDIFIKNFD